MSKVRQSTGRPTIKFCCEASGHLPYGTGRLPYGTGRLPYGTGRLPYGTGHLPYGTGRLPIGVCGEATGHLYCSFSGLKAVCSLASALDAASPAELSISGNSSNSSSGTCNCIGNSI